MNMRKVVLALLLIALMGCRNTMDTVKETPTMNLPFRIQEIYSVEEVEKIARIEIPASATEVQVYGVTGWMDDAALIKFKLPADELDSFLEKYGFHDLETGYWSIQDGPPSIDWWPNRQPGSKPPIEKYLGGKIDRPGFVQNILVDITYEDFYIVYLFCFET